MARNDGKTLDGRGLIRTATIALVAAIGLAWGVAQGVARAEESKETSAAQQLGLKPHGQGQLTQTVVTSRAGDELFGFDVDVQAEFGECADRRGKGYLGFRRAGGQLQLLGRVDPLATPAVIGDGREAMVTFTPNCTTKQQAASPYNWKALERIRLLRGALGHMPNSSIRLSAIAEPAHTAIAANRDGRLAVAWLAPHGRVGIGTEVTNQLFVSIGHTRGPMSTTQIVGGDSYATRVRLAWASSDELLVVYSVNKRLLVQTWTPDHGFGRPQTLGSCDFTPWGPDLTVAAGPAGHAAIAWGTQEDTIEPDSPWTVYGTVRIGTYTRFGTARLLDPGQAENRVPGMYDDGPNDVTAGIGVDEFTTLAWSSAELAPGREDPAHAVVVDPDGHFNPVQELAPESTDVTLMETHGGGTLAQWKADHELRQASREPRGESFGPAGASTIDAGLIDGAELIDSATGG